MKLLILILGAAAAYLIGGWNPAIMLSKAIYHKDIRTCGSGNPGFTNFKRTFGNKWAWWVFFLDLFKAAFIVALVSVLYHAFGGSFTFAAALTGAFAMLGHAFPAWYGFKGGKGFLVYMSVIWFLDWRAGVIAAILLVVLLLTVKIMSLSSLSAVIASAAFIAIYAMFPVKDARSLSVILICVGMALFVVIRHHENIKRLFRGEEKKFNIFGK